MRKWIVALGLFFLSIGSFFLYFGLRAYLFPQVRGHLHGGAAFASIGAIILIAGIILMLLAVASKPKKMTNPISRRLRAASLDKKES